ncbi:MAG: hypothetical protein Tp1124DCM108671_21 [Prokaryotic dsDNA virus sp.]|nr:MAG: hypothetical protein Tp1125DCM102451_41 [Prokaryotic dsDNA virus sp.]QDP65578.1 MAG: hypothetical protein Tp1124DCM108671_21 [Prokaryotic dsDNA virus sp.]|tara:strand:- start:7575 stop:8441 length:867 start_codon:yes stop_codon:yes gene_type:complete
MDFKKGYKIKPKRIDHYEDGLVIFTDGTREMFANERCCLEYGYHYNKKTGKCYAYPISRDIKSRLNTKGKAKDFGEGNKIRSTTNSLISGSNNKTGGGNNNLLISGSFHEVGLNMQDSSLIGGNFGKVLRRGEVVIGGGGFYDTSTALGTAGLTQMSTILLSGTTTNASDTNLSIQGDGSSYITVQTNSLLAFECHVNALVTGGDDGTAGHYRYEKIVGTVLVNNSGTRTYNQTTTTVKSNGTVGGTATTLGNTGDDVTLTVVGTASTNVQWSASIIITENKLATVTF